VPGRRGSAAPIQGKFWEKPAGGGDWTWHEADPDPAEFVPTTEPSPRFPLAPEGPVYVSRLAHNARRDALRHAVNNAMVGPPARPCIYPYPDPRAHPGIGISCFNWALTGSTDRGVLPGPVFGYVRRHELSEHMTSDRYIDDIGHAQTKHWVRHRAPALDALRPAHPTAFCDTHDRDPPEVHRCVRDPAEVHRCVEAVFVELVQANGLVVSNSPTPYSISMHYKMADGITFDHWWLTVDGRVVETFPSLQGLAIQLNEQPHDGMGIVRCHIKDLKPEHLDELERTLRHAHLA